MKKDKPVKIMALIACVLASVNILLNCLCMIFPNAALSVLEIFGFGEGRFEEYSLGNVLPLAIIGDILTPAAVFAVALVNAVSDTFTHTKGILTVIFAVISRGAAKIISSFFYNICIRMINTREVGLFAMTKTVTSCIDILNFCALLLVVSSAAIEIYASAGNLNAADN